MNERAKSRLLAGRDWLNLRGDIVIKVKGARPERFINSALRAGVALHNVDRLSQSMMVATVSAASFKQLRLLTHSGAWKITIVRRLGLPFVFHKIVRRRGLLIGGVLSLLTLYVLSSYIWFVDVQGSMEIPAEQIRDIARDNGLRPGAPRYSLETEAVERGLLLALDKLAWVTVDIRGTLATVKVAEKVTPSTDLTLPGDVVAKREGVVDGIVTLRGVPVISGGDTVRAGQLLISGLIPVQDPAHEERITKGEAPYIHAAGIVKARVWYEGEAEAALALRTEVNTGKTHHYLTWQWQTHSGQIGTVAPYKVYNERITKIQPGIGRFRLPASVTLVRQSEVRIEFTPTEPDAVRETALSAAWEQVQAALPVGASLTQPPQVTIELADDNGDEVVRAKVAVEVIEDIALFQPIANPAPEAAAAPVFNLRKLPQPIPGP